LKLAFDLYEAEKPESNKDPIVFIHGLFGSRKNNRSMSK
jgi:pimeloyl-ACP methyl ester carboxylesterase